MLLAFYLACIKRKKVLVIRRLKTSELKNAVVYLDQGSSSRLTNLSSIDIVAIRRQTQGAIVLVDGFHRAEVDDAKTEYAPFHFLATSCQYDAKQECFNSQLWAATFHSRSVGVIQVTCGDQADWLEAQLFNASFENHTSVYTGGPDGHYKRPASHYNGRSKAVTFDYEFATS
ncbi:hypothetical protein DVH05_003837 [Phytophthora capsici]|nr:hypothetical protein DVH05_003837 [Phytophthora capsici]